MRRRIFAGSIAWVRLSVTTKGSGASSDCSRFMQYDTVHSPFSSRGTIAFQAAQARRSRGSCDASVCSTVSLRW